MLWAHTMGMKSLWKFVSIGIGSFTDIVGQTGSSQTTVELTIAAPGAKEFACWGLHRRHQQHNHPFFGQAEQNCNQSSNFIHKALFLHNPKIHTEAMATGDVSIPFDMGASECWTTGRVSQKSKFSGKRGSFALPKSSIASSVILPPNFSIFNWFW